jgi:hypothetical protein
MVTLLTFLLCGGYFLECFRRRSSWRVFVFTHGFVYFKGRSADTFHWEEVEHIQERDTYLNGDSRPTFYAYWIKHVDGHRIVLNYHLRDVVELGSIIKQRVAPARVQYVRERVDGKYPKKWAGQPRHAGRRAAGLQDK